MSTANHLPQLTTAAQLLEAAGAQVKRLVDGAQGLDAKIDLARRLEAEVLAAVGGIAAITDGLMAQTKTQVAGLMAERRETALSVVASMLADGSLDMARLAQIAGVSVAPKLDQAPALVVAAPVAPAAPAAAPAPIPAGASKSLRENLSVQAGYLNPVKYRDPATGAGWSGRGPMPKWLKDLAANGKSVEDYRVDSAPAAPAAPAAPVAAQAPAPAAESAEAPVPTPDPVEQAVSNQKTGDDDIGETSVVSFDASDLDADAMPSDGEGADDIGEIVDGIASMQLPGSDGIASFMAA